MKPSTYQGVMSHERLSSSGSSDAKTATIPAGTSAIMVTVETGPARMTVGNAGDPTSTTGLVVQKDQNPWFLPIGPGASLRFAGTTGASVIQLAYI